MTFPAYPKYKGSEASWLGALPSHWEVKRLKWLLEANDGGVWGIDADDDDATVVLRSTEQTVDGRWQIVEPALRKLTPEEKSSALLRRGDLLLTKSSGSSLHIGKTSLVDESVEALDACYSNFMQRLRASSCLLPKFAWYILNNEVARLQFDLLSKSTTGLANLNGSIIGELLVATAPIAEQQAIVTFLDRETGKIDALVAEQENLIELLKEKRQAVISHAVTKGLDPNVPMKDSGVEWLRQVPEHWEVSRIKFACSHVVDCLHTTPHYDGDLLYPAIRTADLERGVLLLEQARMVSEAVYQERIQRLRPEADDILYSREGERFGLAALVPSGVQLCLGQRMMMFRAKPSWAASFLMWFLNGDAVYKQVLQKVGGATSPHINISDIVNFAVARPPEAEQKEIAAWLGRETANVDRLVDESQRAIELLKERRAALISAAVTGKIDVRGLVDDLPPMSEALELA